MILVDFRQIANVIFYSSHNEIGYEVDPFKHRFLNYLLFMRSRFKNKYGEIVVALDSSNYWRKDIFPHYKASRAKNRDASDIDWKKVYANFDELTSDLKTYIPWKVVEAHGAEADDVIGILSARFHQKEPILIISADKDFLQLQKYPGIVQYSPTSKKLLVETNPEAALREKIIRGDEGDGIPTINCKDDKFVAEEKVRAASITKKWLEQVLKTPNIEELLTEEQKVGYKRNQRLIDFSFIPKEISQNIIEAYSSYIPPKKSGVYSYLNDKGYTNLMDMLEHF